MCFKFKSSQKLYERVLPHSWGAAIGEEFLTAVCSHCHAAESSVIYSVIGA